MNKLDSIIFDLDGTLWDSTDELLLAWNKVLDKYDEVVKKFSKEDIEGYMGTPITEIYNDFLHYIDPVTRKNIEKDCNKSQMEHLEVYGAKLFPGLENLLKELTKNYKLFIVSNCQDGYIETFMKFNGFEDYFIDFEHPGRTGLSKGENIKLIIKRNKLTKAIYIGDTKGDSEAARHAAIPFVYARYGFGEVEDYDYSIDELEELAGVIQSLESLSKNLKK